MQRLVNLVGKDMENFEENKEKIYEVLDETNQYLLDVFKSNNFQDEDNSLIQAQVYYDEETFRLKTKLEKLQEHSELALQEGVEVCRDNLNSFLKIYHFGFIREFSLTK